MSETNTPSLLPERDYEAIESAVMETERGRWFLAEYARRNRSADTDMLLSAIRKLEGALSEMRSGPAADGDSAGDQLRFDLMEMAATIAQTRLDIAAISPQSGQNGHITTVTSELGSIVTATETATYEILQGAEGVQEVAWSMRQAGMDSDLCAQIEGHVTEIFSACEFQDLTGQRIVKVVQVLEYIEKRLNSMIDIWGDETLIAKAAMSPDLSITDSPLQPAVAISQGDVDELMWADIDSLPDGTSIDSLGPIDMGDLDFHAEAAGEQRKADVEPSADIVDPDSFAFDTDRECLAAEDQEPEPGTPDRRQLMELSQDVRTILFS